MGAVGIVWHPAPIFYPLPAIPPPQRPDSEDPAASPRSTVHGTLGGVNYIQCTFQVKESKIQ